MDVLEGLHPAGEHQIRAGIGDAGDAQGQKMPVRVERQVGFGLMVAGLMVGEKNLAAGGDPLDRPADALGRPQDQHMLGVDEILGAEPAADIGRNEPYCRRRHAQHPGGVVARGVDALARDVRRIPAIIRIPNANHPARLDRVGDDPVVVELQFDNMGRRGKCRIDRVSVSGMPIEADVARHLGRNFWRPGCARGRGGRHRRQRAIVHHHPLGGVEGLDAGLGDDQRHRLADIANLAFGEHRLRCKGERLAGLSIGSRRGL